MKEHADVLVYGASRCHKSNYYKNFLEQAGVSHHFCDVEASQEHEKDCRALYEDGNLKFPTLVVKGKKLRNPRVHELEKWFTKKDIQFKQVKNDKYKTTSS